MAVCLSRSMRCRSRRLPICLCWRRRFQLFAHHVWSIAAGPGAITLDDARAAVEYAGAEIERRTLEPRLDHRSARELKFLAILDVSMARIADTSL